jgi:hypothetical protein
MRKMCTRGFTHDIALKPKPLRFQSSDRKFTMPHDLLKKKTARHIKHPFHRNTPKSSTFPAQQSRETSPKPTANPCLHLQSLSIPDLGRKVHHTTCHNPTTIDRSQNRVPSRTNHLLQYRMAAHHLNSTIRRTTTTKPQGYNLGGRTAHKSRVKSPAP